MKKRPGQYHVKEPLEFAEVVRIQQRAAKAFPSFTDTSTSESLGLMLNPKGGILPLLEEMDAVRWEKISLFNYLPPGAGSVETMGEILRPGLRAIGKPGWIYVKLGFERQGTQKKPNRYERVGIQMRDERLCFCYEMSYPYPVGKERKELFRRIFKVARLPLAIGGRKQDVMEWDFSLKHKDGGEVQIGASDGAAHDFDCELPGATLDDALDRVESFLKEFATPKPFTMHWVIGSEREASLALCKRVYSAATTFPSKKFSILADAKLDKIEGAKQLRALCGGSNRIPWELCRFELRSERAKGGQVEATLWVVTDREGHWLSLEMEPVDPPLLPEIKKKLKADLRVLVT